MEEICSIQTYATSRSFERKAAINIFIPHSDSCQEIVSYWSEVRGKLGGGP